MKTLSRLLLAALVLGWTQAAAAQTADEIVEKYLTAIGGRAALAKLTSRTTLGTITLSTPQGDLSGPLEIYNQVPNKSRTVGQAGSVGVRRRKMTVDQRFDGTAAYVIDTLQGNRDIVGSQLENMKNAAFPTPLLNYQERGVTLALAGKEKIGDRDAYLLVLTPKSGSAARQSPRRRYLCEIRSVVKVELPQFGEVEQMTEFADYRDVDGVKVPFAVKATSAVQSSSIVITKVEHNAKIDQALFSKP